MPKDFRKMPEGVSIRLYVPEDYQEVRRNLEERGLFYQDMDSEERLNEKAKRNPGSIIVAEKNGKVIGNVFLIEDGWAFFVFRLAVAREQQTQGVGSGLMRAAEKEAKKRGYNEVHILVGEKEAELQNYYQELGYKKGNLYRWMYHELKNS